MASLSAETKAAIKDIARAALRRLEKMRPVYDPEEALLTAIRQSGGLAGLGTIIARQRHRYNEHRSVRVLEALERWAKEHGAE